MAAKLTLNSDFIARLPNFPEWVDTAALDDGNAHSYTIPADAHVLYLNPVDAAGANQPIFASIVGTAAEPATGTDVTDGTASFPVVGPFLVKVKPGATLSLIRCGASEVFVSIGVFSKKHVRV